VLLAFKKSLNYNWSRLSILSHNGTLYRVEHMSVPLRVYIFTVGLINGIKIGAAGGRSIIVISLMFDLPRVWLKAPLLRHRRS